MHYTTVSEEDGVKLFIKVFGLKKKVVPEKYDIKT